MTSIAITPLKKMELAKYIEIGRAFFPHADWDGAPKRLYPMLGRWEDGILVALDIMECIQGYYTLWPITIGSFGRFVDGSLKDEDVGVQLMPKNVQIPHHYWILTAVAVKPKAHDLRKRIIIGILKDLFARMQRNSPCHVIAHAATADGHRFLARTGFENPNPQEPTVYTLSHPSSHEFIT